MQWRSIATLPARFHQDLRDAHEAACAGQAERFHGRLGDMDFLLEYAGSGASRMLGGALSHLAVAPHAESPGHTAWISHATILIEGHGLPSWCRTTPGSPWIARLSDTNHRVHMDDWLQALVAFASGGREVCVRYPPPECLPLYETTAPLRHVFQEWTSGRGSQIIHAAAVAPPGKKALLLAGPGGSGKSTTALTALEAGWRYLSDDLCVVHPVSPPHVTCLYNTAKLRTSSLDRFPRLAALISSYHECGEDKHVFSVHRHFPSQLALEVEVGAILVVSVGKNERTRVEKTGWKEAVNAIVPWSRKQLPTAGQEIPARTFALATRLPVYRVELGSDAENMLESLERLA